MSFPKQSQEKEIKDSPFHRSKNKLAKAKKAIMYADKIFKILTSEKYISIVNSDKNMSEALIDYGVYTKEFKNNK